MHAALVSVTIDPGKEDEARAMLASQIVPMVKQSDGFVAGYWTEPRDGKGFSVVVFDSEEHAKAAAPPAGMRPPGAPVVVDTVEFREVIATA
jgi:heme-degrading monooxygenase HmoA